MLLRAPLRHEGCVAYLHARTGPGYFLNGEFKYATRCHKRNVAVGTSRKSTTGRRTVLWSLCKRSAAHWEYGIELLSMPLGSHENLGQFRITKQVNNSESRFQEEEREGCLILSVEKQPTPSSPKEVGGHPRMRIVLSVGRTSMSSMTYHSS
jgi:hypothetical protein